LHFREFAFEVVVGTANSFLVAGLGLQFILKLLFHVKLPFAVCLNFPVQLYNALLLFFDCRVSQLDFAPHFFDGFHVCFALQFHSLQLTAVVRVRKCTHFVF
jgi:hypothetical protein